jgi:uncharacterized protein (DUF58 family)
MSITLQSDAVARAEALGIKARAVVEGLRIGDHRSPYRGFSVEFVQHREYVPGDDLRYVDWKVYGRHERYTIKQYEQETNFIGHLVLDASASMEYGAHNQKKLTYAKLLAATLAYVIVGQGDAVSLSIFDSSWRKRVPPSSQPAQVKTVLLALEEVEPDEKTALGPLLHELVNMTSRRGLVFLISDCFDEPAAILDALRHLRFAGHEVTLFHILHPDELTFPFEGHVRFDGLEDASQFLTRPHLIQAAYRRAMQGYRDQLQKGCEALLVDYVLTETSDPLSNVLAHWLARRRRIRRM